MSGYYQMTSFPYFICSNITAASANRVYISQFIRFYRACGSCQDFLDRGFLLTRKLLNQGFLLVKLKSSFSVATMTWLTVMEYLGHKWPWICSINFVVNTSRSFPHSWLITRCVTRLTWRSTWVHPRFLVLQITRS